MRILVLGVNYLLEPTAIGPYTADLAVHLKQCGHEVVVSTGFPTAPAVESLGGLRGAVVDARDHRRSAGKAYVSLRPPSSQSVRFREFFSIVPLHCRRWSETYSHRGLDLGL